MNPFLQILYGALGTLGFCLFLHVRKARFLAATLNGAASCAVYLLLDHLGFHVFFCSFGAAFLASGIAELLARAKKVPSIVFCMTGIVPLVPGSSLYYMMEALVKSDYETAGQKAFFLTWTILGIGAGCALTIALMNIYRKAAKRRKEQ